MFPLSSGYRGFSLSWAFWTATLCFASLCTIFCDSRVYPEYISGNGSVEPMFPTPLIVLLNESDVASLRVQADNVSNSVSNTSLNDLYRDNDTQQMQIKYRERKRQERLLLIQQEILQKLGLSKQPNVTSGLSDDERQRMFQMFNRSYYAQHNTTSDNEVQGLNTAGEETTPS